MQDFKLTILGCGAAVPTASHLCSSQVLSLRNKNYMIDCGEGTQYQLRRLKFHFGRLGHIFISHLHGDHWFGLPGLVSSFGLEGRNEQLHIHAPARLEGTINHLLQTYCPHLGFEVVFHAVDPAVHQLVHEDRSVRVFSLPLQHTVPCCGYLFEEVEGRRYAYMSDTMYAPDNIPFIKGVDTLYHEATYTAERTEAAAKYGHSTATEAATIAKEAEVGKLIIGHYSKRYHDETILLDEAKKVFANTFLARETKVFDV